MRRPQNILITGGTGTLGKELIRILDQELIPYTIASRTNPENLTKWSYLDLQNGEGVEEAVKGKEIIFHLASGTKKISEKTEVNGTRLLLKAAKASHIKHFIYISIVGVDIVPVNYYKLKVKAEQEIIKSGIPYTKLRATQFHSFVDTMLGKLLKFPICFIPPKVIMQPIASAMVAKTLFYISENSPLNKTINIGGNEIMKLDELAEIWLRIQNKRKIILPVPILGNYLKSLSRGGLTCQEKSDGITWRQWLEKKHQRSSSKHFLRMD